MVKEKRWIEKLKRRKERKEIPCIIERKVDLIMLYLKKFLKENKELNWVICFCIGGGVKIGYDKWWDVDTCIANRKSFAFKMYWSQWLDLDDIF